ncbi:ROK family protein [Microbacterium sp. MEC084]|nr:ROK family protein [Microbacterium sp. MEC084]
MPGRLGGPGIGDFFQLFRDGNARTRAELISLTGLARSTVALRVDALLTSGLLQPAPDAASSGGRPPARLVINPSARLIVAVDLGATHGVVALTDLNGRVLESVRDDIRISDGPEPVLEWACDRAEALLAASHRRDAPLAGVGIGVPGPVEHSTGRAVKPPIMPGWDGFDIPDFVGRRLGTTVLVDNDVNVLALGEHASVWPSVDDLLFVKVSTGIGLGIISGGTLRRGAQGTAGDIGRVQVPMSRDSRRPPGDERDLEAIASAPAIAAALAADGVPVYTTADLVALLSQGDARAVRATREAGREIGEVLATVVNLLNPSVITIGGLLARASEDLIAGIREVVYRRSTPLATEHLLIVPSTSRDFAGVLGAAIMVSQHFLSPTAVETLIAEELTTKTAATA